MENNLEIILKSRISETVKNISVLEKSIDSDIETLEILRHRVIGLKKDNPEAKAIDAKNEIIESEIVNFNVTVKRTEWSNIANTLTELYTVAVLSNVELGLSEEDSDKIKQISAAGKSPLIIKGEDITYSDEEYFKSIIEGISKSAENEEKLELAFNSPYFSFIKK